MKFTLRNLFLIILFAGILYLTLIPISDPDFRLHLRTGQLIAQTFTIPHTDPFSFTNFGKPWITHEWLTELFIFLLYRLGSYGLLIIAFGLIITFAFFFTYLRCPSESKPYVAGFVLFLGMIMSFPIFGVRPQMISLLLTSIFLFLLDRYKKTGKLRFILFLPVIILLWVNLHAGYFLGLVVLAIYIFADLIEWLVSRFYKNDSLFSPSWKSLVPLTCILFLCLFATLINPNGYKLLIYPFQTLTDPVMQQYIQEWQSPDFHSMIMLPFAVMILALIGFGLTGKRRISFTNILLILAFGYEALHSIRNIPIFALVAIPVLAEQISSWVKIQSTSKISKPMKWVFPILVIGIAVLLVHDFIRVNNSQTETVTENFPQGAVNWILTNKPQGQIFNYYNWGGYLIWRLYPEYLVYIDGRADVYGDEFLLSYANISTNANWEQFLDHQNIHLVIIDPTSNLANVLRQSPDWKISFKDKISVIFTKIND